MEKSAIKTAVDVFNTTEFIKNYPNDQTIHDISVIISGMCKLINIVSNTDLIEILERGLQDPELDKALLNPPKVGMIKLMNSMRDDDVQRGIGIMIELLKAIGRASVENDFKHSIR